MKFLKCEKGLFGYINKQRKIEILKTIFMFACAIIIYFVGYSATKTNKNLFTVLAVLSVLPAAKSAVIMIMFFRFSSISKDEYDLIEKNRGNIPTLYELVFTTTEKSFYVKNACCADNTIVMFLNNKNNKSDSVNELRNHIISAIEREGLSGYSVKIYTVFEEYLKRIKEMDSKLNGITDKSSSAIFNMFRAITI